MPVNLATVCVEYASVSVYHAEEMTASQLGKRLMYDEWHAAHLVAQKMNE